MEAVLAPAAMRRVLKRMGSAVAWAACLMAAGCATVAPQHEATALAALYDAAIRDAAVFDPAHRAPLRTTGVEGATATVVTWLRMRDAARAFPPGDVTLTQETWVTLDGDVRERCRRYARDEAELTTRLHQLLGLSPTSESRVFVTFRAPVAAMFRPCLDPDVTRMTCDRDAFPAGVSTAHAAWIAGQMVSSYRVGDAAGRPFTGLGYTYDWAPDSDHVGPSEYVVRAGTKVQVVARESSSDYCAR